MHTASGYRIYIYSNGPAKLHSSTEIACVGSLPHRLGVQAYDSLLLI